MKVKKSFLFRLIEDICKLIFFKLILALDGSLNHLSCALTIAWFFIKVLIGCNLIYYQFLLL